MSFIEGIFETILGDVIRNTIKRIGSFVRWVFLRNRFLYNEIYNQSWNTRIGLLFLVVFMITLIWYLKV